MDSAGGAIGNPDALGVSSAAEGILRMILRQKSAFLTKEAANYATSGAEVAVFLKSSGLLALK